MVKPLPVTTPLSRTLVSRVYPQVVSQWRPGDEPIVGMGWTQHAPGMVVTALASGYLVSHMLQVGEPPQRAARPRFCLLSHTLCSR